MDADKLLCWCIYLYMKKRGWQSSAETFRKECGISEDDVGIDHFFVDTMWSNFHGMCVCAVRTPNPSKATVPEITDNARENTLHVGSPRIVQSMQQFEASTSYGNMTMPPKTTSLEGISLQEVSLDSSVRPVVVCDFSSDGRLLAGANSIYLDLAGANSIYLDRYPDCDTAIECDSIGFDNMVLIWNTQTFDCVTVPNAHDDFITDVRFKPGSTVFASSSNDGAIKIWDAANIFGSLEPSTVLQHGRLVQSLDFHPTEDILWSCDIFDMIHVWNVNDRSIISTFPGGTDKVRFQPPLGKLLAAGSGNDINIFDVNSFSVFATLRGHVNVVLSLCWDKNGDWIASLCRCSVCTSLVYITVKVLVCISEFQWG